MSYTFDYPNMKFQVIPIKTDHAMDSCLGACHFLANSHPKFQFDLETIIFVPESQKKYQKQFSYRSLNISLDTNISISQPSNNQIDKVAMMDWQSYEYYLDTNKWFHSIEYLYEDDCNQENQEGCIKKK